MTQTDDPYTVNRFASAVRDSDLPDSLKTEIIRCCEIWLNDGITPVCQPLDRDSLLRQASEMMPERNINLLHDMLTGKARASQHMQAIVEHIRRCGPVPGLRRLQQILA